MGVKLSKSQQLTCYSESRCVPVAGQVGQVVQVGDPVETYNVYGIASFPGSSAPEREIEFTCVHFTFQRAWERGYMVDISSYKPHTQTLIIHTWEQDPYHTHLGTRPLSYTPGNKTLITHTWEQDPYHTHLGTRPLSYTPGNKTLIIHTWEQGYSVKKKLLS